MPPELIVVDVFTTATEAQLARSKLLAAGIHAEVVAENLSSWWPELEASLAVELRVAPEDANRSRQILSDVREKRRDDESNAGQ